MKMAKASQADLDLAIRITSAIEACERGVMPAGLCEDQFERDEFDIHDPRDCKRVIQHLLDIAEAGSLARVTWGMFVLLDPENKILDPNVDHLALHPDLSDAGKMRKERDQALAKCAEWESKAATWFASTEARQQLDGYRDLAQRLANAEAKLLTERARLDFVLGKAIALYGGQLTWTDEDMRTHFVSAEDLDIRQMIDQLMMKGWSDDSAKAEG